MEPTKNPNVSISAAVSSDITSAVAPFPISPVPVFPPADTQAPMEDTSAPERLQGSSSVPQTVTHARAVYAVPTPSLYRDPSGTDFTGQRKAAQPIPVPSNSSSSFWPQSPLDSELDEAFLGLQVEDPRTMNPALDFSSRKPLPTRSSTGMVNPMPLEASPSDPPSSVEVHEELQHDVTPARTPVIQRILGKVPFRRSQTDAPTTSATRDLALPATAAATAPNPSAAATPTTPAAQTGTITFRNDLRKQTMLGIGYSNAFYTNYWHTAHPYSAEIYNYMLSGLRPSMLRIRNNFGIGADADMVIDQQFWNLANTLLGYKPTLLMASWTPPANLKVSGRLNGRNFNPNVPITDVLKKDSNGIFVYADYAKYWVDSLKAYRALGLTPDYVSPQNEPNFSGDGSPTCLFGAVETSIFPGYFQAATAVYNAMRSAFTNPPAMIGPEATGFDHYLAEFPMGGGGQFAAIGNHLYGSGQFGRPTFDPNSFTAALVRARGLATAKGVQNLWMTEFGKLSAFEYTDPLNMSILIHNTLTIASVQVYLHWDGAWGVPDVGPPTQGTLILVENPFKNRSTWLYPRGYKVLQSYHWFKHFTRFIRPTYRRVQCDIAGLTNVLASAWISLNSETSVILINTGTVVATITLTGFPTPNTGQVTDRYYSTLDVPFTYSGQFQGRSITLPPLSITSLSTHNR